jgi:LysR family glycine cleavage system transcriptional activator
MSRIPLHPLQGFLVAARLGNLSRAADSLNLTVSALSHQIRALEERVDQRLFVRGPRGITLTADGERLFESVATHFDAIERALRPCGSRRDDVLTVSLLPSLASSWLVPRLSEFLTRHPQLEINLQSSASLVDFERESGVDAALRFGPGKWPGVTAVHLFDDWITPVASPALIAAQRRGKKTDGLGSYPLLGDPGGRWAEWFARFGGTPPKRYVAGFDDTETLQRAATAGMGVALARLTLTRPLIDAGLLVTLSPHRLKSDYAHYLVYPPRSDDHAGLIAFRDWLQAQARAYASVLAADAPAPTRRKRIAPARR